MKIVEVRITISTGSPISCASTKESGEVEHVNLCFSRVRVTSETKVILEECLLSIDVHSYTSIVFVWAVDLEFLAKCYPFTGSCIEVDVINCATVSVICSHLFVSVSILVVDVQV